MARVSGVWNIHPRNVIFGEQCIRSKGGAPGHHITAICHSAQIYLATRNRKISTRQHTSRSHFLFFFKPAFTNLTEQSQLYLFIGECALKRRLSKLINYFTNCWNRAAQQKSGSFLQNSSVKCESAKLSRARCLQHHVHWCLSQNQGARKYNLYVECLHSFVDEYCWIHVHAK